MVRWPWMKNINLMHTITPKLISSNVMTNWFHSNRKPNIISMTRLDSHITLLIYLLFSVAFHDNLSPFVCCRSFLIRFLWFVHYLHLIALSTIQSILRQFLHHIRHSSRYPNNGPYVICTGREHATQSMGPLTIVATELSGCDGMLLPPMVWWDDLCRSAVQCTVCTMCRIAWIWVCLHTEA